jgi:hypothetical protein
MKLWYPTGHASGDRGGAGTSRNVVIDYAPAIARQLPALYVSHRPGDDVDVPAFLLHSEAQHIGPNFAMHRVESGLFLLGAYEGENVITINQDGDIDTNGYAYALQANAGGVYAVGDGSVDVNMSLGNVFTCTPTQNTTYTTTSPTNGLGAQRATFVINNSGGYTVAWSTGFTGITPIAAADTGIHLRIMQFDGTTWRQLVATEDGTVINVPNEDNFVWTVFNPNATYNIDTHVLLWKKTPYPFTVTNIEVSTNSASYDASGDIKYADDFLGFGSPTTINSFSTTSGVLSDDTPTNPDVPADKALYMEFSAEPDVNMTQINIDLTVQY